MLKSVLLMILKVLGVLLVMTIIVTIASAILRPRKGQEQ